MFLTSTAMSCWPVGSWAQWLLVSGAVFGGVAQLVEHYVRNVGVVGSSPITSTKIPPSRLASKPLRPFQDGAVFSLGLLVARPADRQAPPGAADVSTACMRSIVGARRCRLRQKPSVRWEFSGEPALIGTVPTRVV